MTRHKQSEPIENTIMEFFSSSDFDHAVGDMSKQLNLSYKVVRYHVMCLVERGKVVITRKVGYQPMFQLRNWNKR